MFAIRGVMDGFSARVKTLTVDEGKRGVGPEKWNTERGHKMQTPCQRLGSDGQNTQPLRVVNIRPKKKV